MTDKVNKNRCAFAFSLGEFIVKFHDVLEHEDTMIEFERTGVNRDFLLELKDQLTQLAESFYRE